MAEINLSQMSKRDVYGWMIQSILPRPIAWILSDNGDGGYNLAPFSYFNGVAGDPPLISVSIGHKPDGSKKDTWKNIEERKHFVVHIPSVAHAKQVTESSASLPHGESELNQLGLALQQQEGWPLPRIYSCVIAMSCKLHQIIEIGEGPQGFILGQIEHLYINDKCLEQQGERTIINPKTVDPLCRLGGIRYGTLGEVFEVARPK